MPSRESTDPPEECFDGDGGADPGGQLPGEPLHQRRHPVVPVVVSGEDPHHPQAVHHLRQRVRHRREGRVAAHRLTAGGDVSVQNADRRQLMSGAQVSGYTAQGRIQDFQR